jgi:hypothetical protein
MHKLSMLTCIFSALTLSAGSALACTTYWQPRINGLEVDRCIDSNQYPDGCSRGATEHAADRFCQEMGHAYASQWQWQDQSTDNQRTVYKLLEEPGNSYFRTVQGSFILTGVTCRD